MEGLLSTGSTPSSLLCILDIIDIVFDLYLYLNTLFQELQHFVSTKKIKSPHFSGEFGQMKFLLVYIF